MWKVKHFFRFYRSHVGKTCIYRHVPNSPRNKNVKSLMPNFLPKMVFLAPKTLLCHSTTWKKNFFSTLNVMISQTVRNPKLRFGMHEYIQVSYKVSRLHTSNFVKDCKFACCIKRGQIWRLLAVLRPLSSRGLQTTRDSRMPNLQTFTDLRMVNR